MIDIHHHLLFGLDDGAKDLEMSVAMAEAALANGITHVVCTPHSNYQYSFDPEINRQKLAQLESRLDGRLTLGLGCDFHLSFDNLEDQDKNPSKYTINGTQYLLVEFPDFGIPESIGNALFTLNARGVVPIITHPERNSTLVAHPERMIEWLQSGCLIQITAGSLLGRFGNRASAMCHDLLAKNWVHFIASDAHNLTSRPANMREGHEALAKRYGKETAERLAVNNPRAVFLGERLGVQPEPIGLYEEFNQKKPGLLSRIFSR
jgi:protein-tyrosine phosphatase